MAMSRVSLSCIRRSPLCQSPTLGKNDCDLTTCVTHCNIMILAESIIKLRCGIHFNSVYIVQCVCH